MRICGHRCERFPPCAPPCCLFFRLFSLFRQHPSSFRGFPDGSQFLLGIGGISYFTQASCTASHLSGSSGSGRPWMGPLKSGRMVTLKPCRRCPPLHSFLPERFPVSVLYIGSRSILAVRLRSIDLIPSPGGDDGRTGTPQKGHVQDNDLAWIHSDLGQLVPCNGSG